MCDSSIHFSNIWNNMFNFDYNKIFFLLNINKIIYLSVIGYLSTYLSYIQHNLYIIFYS